ncbi:CoA transferase [Amycolatopsis sp. GM8]|uniref:CaiB/BaiF CoA-transferase family protein n=1 Tax=Amycolatopsis sp. GM8 TaxID=2896530 RepID=UPI001F22D503|nr:CoA transferase [Amycolatopsis sp. GM8]
MSAMHDIRVLDLTEGTAGPIVGMFLADFGADVVKVEQAIADPARHHTGFAMWNRGKRGVVIDSSDATQLSWLRRQAMGADVLLTSGAPQLAALGLDSGELLRHNGRLVLVEMPPYLPGGTPWAGGHESAALLAALGGQAWRQSSSSGEPVESVYPTVLYSQGLWATACTVAALIERERSGCGQRVTVSGVNGLMQLLTSGLVVNPDAGDLSTAVGLGGRHPTYTRIQAGDGVWVAVGALGRKFEAEFLRILGISDILAEPRMGGLTDNLVLPENFAWAREKVAEAFRAAPSTDWVAALDAAGIPYAIVADRREWLDHPQIRAIGMRAELDDPERGRVVMPGIPIQLSATPGRVRGPAPVWGGRCDTIAPWDEQPAPIAGPIRPGPLHGLTVLVTGAFVATPFSGFLLAELGADVIRVEPVSGDPFRQNAYAVSRGMRSLAIDLKSAGGRAAFYDVVRHADALIDGLRPGATAALEIDYDHLAAVNPRLTVVSMSAYGHTGPMSHLGGVDVVIQGLCGMMRAEGGDGEPVVNTIAVNDNATAAMSAVAVTLGIFSRLRTGVGQHIFDSLIGTATYLQSGELTTYPDAADSPAGAPDYKGPGRYDRMYPVKNGWIRMQAPDNDDTRARLTAAFGGDLADALLALEPDDAVAALTAAGVPAVRVRKIGDVIRDPRLLESEFLHLVPASDGRSFISAPGRYATFSRTGRFGPLVPPGLGEHSRAVLVEAGVAPERVDELVAAGDVAEGGPIERTLKAAYR